MCGGTGRSGRDWIPGWGLSPRVRGNPLDNAGRQQRPGSIPACAGEPPRVGFIGRSLPVYPRVCGGTGALDALGAGGVGLSPRVRGNPGWRIAE